MSVRERRPLIGVREDTTMLTSTRLWKFYTRGQGWKDRNNTISVMPGRGEERTQLGSLDRVGSPL